MLNSTYSSYFTISLGIYPVVKEKNYEIREDSSITYS
jgi:hypothetical protein